MAGLAQCTGLRKNFGFISPRLNSAGPALARVRAADRILERAKQGLERISKSESLWGQPFDTGITNGAPGEEKGARAGANLASLSSGRGKWPRICANGRQLRDISNDALRALQAANDPLVLFARSGMLVAVIRDERHRQVIAEVGLDALCGRLARCADYFKVSAGGDEYDCPRPPNVVKDILALAPEEWELQSLDAVTEIPVLRPDGSILDTFGYDRATQLLAGTVMGER